MNAFRILMLALVVATTTTAMADYRPPRPGMTWKVWPHMLESRSSGYRSNGYRSYSGYRPSYGYYGYYGGCR